MKKDYASKIVLLPGTAKTRLEYNRKYNHKNHVSIYYGSAKEYGNKLLSDNRKNTEQVRAFYLDSDFAPGLRWEYCHIP